MNAVKIFRNTSLATNLTLVMQDASRVRSEIEISVFVGVEQAFLFPLIFSGVVFSSTTLNKTLTPFT